MRVCVCVCSDSGISCCSDYQEMQPILSSANKETGTNTNTSDRWLHTSIFSD